MTPQEAAKIFGSPTGRINKNEPQPQSIAPVAKLTAAPTSPILEELFCVVCAMLMDSDNPNFCSKTCEDIWNSYDTGRIDWAVFYELSLS